MPPHLQRQPIFELLHRCPRDFPIKHETSIHDNPFNQWAQFALQYYPTTNHLTKTITVSQSLTTGTKDSCVNRCARLWFSLHEIKCCHPEILLKRSMETRPKWMFPPTNGSTLTWIVSECPFSDLHTSFNGTPKKWEIHPIDETTKKCDTQKHSLQTNN